jgi:hypothetical protein
MACMSLIPHSREVENKKPCKRFSNPGMHVQARTIGTKIMFQMPVENVSATGMLIKVHDGQKTPFNINTILELDVVGPEGEKASDPDNSRRTVQCLGKVVHTSRDEKGCAKYGIKIIQSDENEQIIWDQMIRNVEKTAAI